MNVLGNSRKRGVGYGADIGLREGIQPKKAYTGFSGYLVLKPLRFLARKFSVVEHHSTWDVLRSKSISSQNVLAERLPR